MTNLETWLIIILVVCVIVSNLAILKYSAKFKMTHFGKDHKKTANNNDTTDKQSSTTSKNDDDKD